MCGDTLLNLGIICLSVLFPAFILPPLTLGMVRGSHDTQTGGNLSSSVGFLDVI